MRRIIEAIQMLSYEIKEYNIYAILSLGPTVYKLFIDQIKGGKLKVPSTILLLPSVPQIDILERASLFITHCGMNSAGEAIHYGVPVICLPQGFFTDQPFIARRLADELSLGIRLNSTTFTPGQLVRCMKRMIFDKSYLERAIRLSMLSREYNGSVIGANLIYKTINCYYNKNNK
jgi:UDP:flavonoid glycosyltransferase YjiC (YdhE family)